MAAHWRSLTGTTERRPIRSRSNPVSRGSAFISASDTGRARRRTGATAIDQEGRPLIGAGHGPRATRTMPTAARSSPE